MPRQIKKTTDVDTLKQKIQVLTAENKRLRNGLNEQCKRGYATEKMAARLMGTIQRGRLLMRRASNGVPCSMPGCALCKWDTLALAQVASMTAVKTRLLDSVKVHALEGHIGSAD